MYRWNTGRKPIKKLPRWIMATILLVYTMSLTAMFMPIILNWDLHVEAAYQWPQNYTGGLKMGYWPIAVIALVVILVIGGYIRSLHKRIDILLEQRDVVARLNQT